MKSNGKVIRSIQSEGSGVGPVAVCPKANLFAYAECTIQPRIFILSYPTCKVEAVLEGAYIDALNFVCTIVCNRWSAARVLPPCLFK